MLYLKSRNIYKNFASDVVRSFNGRIASTLKMQILMEDSRTLGLYARLQRLGLDKAIIMGNGPSISTIDRKLLAQYALVGLNRGQLMNQDLKDNYILNVCADSLNYTQNLVKYEQISGPLLANISVRGLTKAKSTYFFACAPDTLPYKTPSSLLPSFGNSAAIAAQVLYFSGIRHVAMVGMDHDYGGLRPLQVVNSEMVRNSYYRSSNAVPGTSVMVQDLERAAYHLRNLSLLYEDSGKLLANCSSISKLVTVPRLTLEEFSSL
jgi:hypothetical protein